MSDSDVSANSTVGENQPPPASTTTISTVPHEITRPDAYKSHEISDGDLMAVGTARRGVFDEFTWASITGTVAAAPSAIQALHDAFFGPNPSGLSLFGLSEILILEVFLTLTITAFVQPRNRGKTANQLIEDIKKRRREVLGGTPETTTAKHPLV
jgi:hypothetical protein